MQNVFYPDIEFRNQFLRSAINFGKTSSEMYDTDSPRYLDVELNYSITLA